MKVIATEKAPGAIGPYSQGFIAGGFVYTSGQIPVNPAEYFTSKPARSCVAVKDLPKGVLCEIEAVAEA